MDLKKYHTSNTYMHDLLISFLRYSGHGFTSASGSLSNFQEVIFIIFVSFLLTFSNPDSSYTCPAQSSVLISMLCSLMCKLQKMYYLHTRTHTHTHICAALNLTQSHFGYLSRFMHLGSNCCSIALKVP